MNPSDDEKALSARIDDMLRASGRRGAVYSSFMDERQCAVSEKLLKERFSENYRFFGGYDNAQRKVLCVYDDYFMPEDKEFPVSPVTFSYRRSYTLTHRDFLGALMGLRLRRDALGDIIVGTGMAQVFVLSSVKEVVLSEITKIGPVGVEADDNCEILLSAEQNFREITGTVASLRLDSVLSLSLGKSRTQTAQIISSAEVRVNFFPVSDRSYEMKQGDIFSVRGFGKFRLEKVSGVTKKGRIHIAVLKYC
ncbi:MAG: RNA-binding protein [Porcipelethomonas sp.]